MAITRERAAELVRIDAKEALDVDEYYGRLRPIVFHFTQGAAAGDADSIQELCELPFGKIRLFFHAGLMHTSAFNAGRTLNLGFSAYEKNDATQGAIMQAEDPTAIQTGIDVAAAGEKAIIGPTNDRQLVVWSISNRGSPVRIISQVKGGTIPAGATIQGAFMYVLD